MQTAGLTVWRFLCLAGRLAWHSQSCGTHCHHTVFQTQLLCFLCCPRVENSSWWFGFSFSAQWYLNQKYHTEYIHCFKLNQYLWEHDRVFELRKSEQLWLPIENPHQGGCLVAHTFNPALGRQRHMDLWVWGQPGLHSKFQNIQSYTEKHYLENKTKEIKKTHIKSSSQNPTRDDWEVPKVPCITEGVLAVNCCYRGYHWFS